MQAVDVSNNIMKKNILIFFTLIAMISCNEKPKRTEELQKQISELKKENKQLKYSLSQVEEQDLYYRVMIGVPDGDFKVGEKNRIVLLFHEFKDIPKYEVFKIEGNKEISIGTGNKTNFEYFFTPKSKADNKLKLKAKIPYKGKLIEIPGEMIFPIK